MQEVLSMIYDAGSASVLVSVSAVRESEHVPGEFVRQLGVPEPTVRFPVSELPTDLQSLFLTFLAGIIPKVVEAHERVVSDPDELARRASAIEAKAFELAQREAALSAIESTAKTE
jgi:hypothetical protein